MGAVAFNTSWRVVGRRKEQKVQTIMKSFIFGFLLSLLLASANCSSLKDRDSCEATCAAQGGGPVCDVNGRQFPNRCDAEQCAKTKVAFEGPCIAAMQDNCICTQDMKPVCGMDNITYDNKCKMDCAKVIMECDRACPCWGIES